MLLTVCSINFTTNAIEVSDPCGDAGGKGNDIKKITASSDGINIIIIVELCVNAEVNTKYSIRIDHQDPNDLDNDNETNEPDTLINHNKGCLETFDSTKTHWIYQPIEEDTGTGIIDLIGNVLTYTVSYSELGLSSGDNVLLWIETNYLGIHERTPNTDSTDGCSKPELPNEVIPLTLNAKEQNYCEDQDTNFKWEALIQEFPDDMQIQTLHALRLGLCLKVDRGDLTVSQASELFNKIRNVFNNENTEGKENELVENKNEGK
jgi:hypothetical protein